VHTITQECDDFLDFAVLHHSSQPHHVYVVKRNHDFQAAGLYFEEIEFFDVLADSATADLLNDPYPVVGIDDLIPNVEISVAADHEETPARAAQERNNTSLF